MDDLVIDIAVSRNPDTGQGGYLYTAIIDNGEETIELASGQEDDLDEAFRIIKNLTERTLA